MVVGQELSGSKRLTDSIFGDKRLDKQYEQITQAIASKQHACIYRLSSSHSERTGFYRFLDNEAVSLERLQLESQRRCALAAAQEDTLLVLHDTTDFDYSLSAGQQGLGPIGNHRGEGYFAHVSMAVSTSGFTPLGIAAARIWHRKPESKKVKPYHIAFEQKESCRWVQACQAAAGALGGANLIHVQDREGDMYDTFAIAEGKHHLLVRSRADRIIETQQGKKTKLSAHLQQLPASGYYWFQVSGECGKKQKREALMQVKYTQVALQRPNKYVYQKHYARQVLVWVIEATEIGAPKGESPVYWRLLTTLPVTNLGQALEKIYYYTRRWLIEELFGMLKKDGFALESLQLETAAKLKKMMLLAMDSAVKILQLKQARDGQSALPLEAVFSGQQIACLKQLEARLEGKTQLLRNPHEKNTLAWACWIIARLGGWSGYASQRKPGTETLKHGLQQFEQIFFGWNLIHPQTCV